MVLLFDNVKTVMVLSQCQGHPRAIDTILCSPTVNKYGSWEWTKEIKTILFKRFNEKDIDAFVCITIGLYWLSRFFFGGNWKDYLHMVHNFKCKEREIIS